MAENNIELDDLDDEELAALLNVVRSTGIEFEALDPNGKRRSPRLKEAQKKCRLARGQTWPVSHRFSESEAEVVVIWRQSSQLPTWAHLEFVLLWSLHKKCFFVLAPRYRCLAASYFVV